MMPIKSEAALEATANVREVLEPAAVGRQLIAVSQSVTNADPLERQVRQWCRRFTDREARMRAALQQHDIIAKHSEYACEQRTGKPAADDGDFAGILHALLQCAQEITDSARPVRLTLARRSVRLARQCSQAARRCESHRSTVTTAVVSCKQRSSVCSSCESVGGVKSPSLRRRSSSPFPGRSGTIETTPAPAATAYSTERTVHSIESSTGTQGVPSSTKVRRSMPFS